MGVLEQNLDRRPQVRACAIAYVRGNPVGTCCEQPMREDRHPYRFSDLQFRLPQFLLTSMEPQKAHAGLPCGEHGGGDAWLARAEGYRPPARSALARRKVGIPPGRRLRLAIGVAGGSAPSNVTMMCEAPYSVGVCMFATSDCGQYYISCTKRRITLKPESGIERTVSQHQKETPARRKPAGGVSTA
ncbi:hypothetical protein SDC9_38264 [bioreactor metagenome]|uniref:Uncharacterized protein n=1 Tax=bioreactor metagenome TaxID=1076179 RepID=A0A644VLP4_9ZZZZ